MLFWPYVNYIYSTDDGLQKLHPNSCWNCLFQNESSQILSLSSVGAALFCRRRDQHGPDFLVSCLVIVLLSGITACYNTFLYSLNIEQTQTSEDAKMKNLFPFAVLFAKWTLSGSTFYTFHINEITLNVLATSVTIHSSVYDLNALSRNGFDSVFNEAQLQLPLQP